MKILIVDDEKPARDRLRQILADEPGYDVVGEAGNGKEALQRAIKLKPDVVLLDIRMPGMQGIEAARHLNAMEPAPAGLPVPVSASDEIAAPASGRSRSPVRRKHQ